ncbi:hypothetical protein MNBD_DELTA01-619 [hydrothermal vent metagenome]|uniref:Uncharacterized protein n=1 Tax=hydrothermal vent metagenome TaxID=652676 RepID=A0A3B0QWP5_9ZZZZ
MNYQLISGVCSMASGFLLLFFREMIARVIIEQNSKWFSPTSPIHTISERNFVRLNLILGILSIVYGVMKIYPMTTN